MFCEQGFIVRKKVKRSCIVWAPLWVFNKLQFQILICIIYLSDDEDEDDDDLAVAATFGVANLFKTSPSSKTSPVKPSNSTKSASGQKVMGPSQQNVDKERLTVDISALRQQYRKLRQRQQQAHIILTCKSTFFLDHFLVSIEN